MKKGVRFFLASIVFLTLRISFAADSTIASFNPAQENAAFLKFNMMLNPLHWREYGQGDEKILAPLDGTFGSTSQNLRDKSLILFHASTLNDQFDDLIKIFESMAVYYSDVHFSPTRSEFAASSAFIVRKMRAMNNAGCSSGRALAGVDDANYLANLVMPQPQILWNENAEKSGEYKAQMNEGGLRIIDVDVHVSNVQDCYLKMRKKLIANKEKATADDWFAFLDLQAQMTPFCQIVYQNEGNPLQKDKILGLYKRSLQNALIGAGGTSLIAVKVLLVDHPDILAEKVEQLEKSKLMKGAVTLANYAKSLAPRLLSESKVQNAFFEGIKKIGKRVGEKMAPLLACDAIFSPVLATTVMSDILTVSSIALTIHELNKMPETCELFRNDIEVPADLLEK